MIETITIKISDEINAWIKRQKNLIGHICKISLALVSTLIVTHPKTAGKILFWIASWQNYFLTYFLIFIVCIYFLYPILKKEWQQEKNELLFYGVSLNKITDYLMTEWTFKREDIERKFWIARIMYYDMVKEMDEAGIFIRGENNMRRVDIRLTKEDIIKLLSPETEEIEKPSNSTELNTDAVQSGFKVSEIIPQT